MNQKILNIVLQHKALFVPHLFTERQVGIIQQYLHKKPLTSTEKAYLYSTVKKKAAALRMLKEEYYIHGGEMIPERVEEAKKILQELNEPQAFISGSFLYKESYNDIDIFIIGRRRRNYYEGKKHFTVIPEKDLNKPIFISAAMYSVATFNPVKIIRKQRVNLEEILFLYQWLINQIFDKEDLKELRDLLLWHSLHAEKKMIDSRSLDLQAQDIKKLPSKDKIQKINHLTKEILFAIFSVKYLYNAISGFFRSIKKMGEEYKTPNIPIFLDFAREVQHECRRA